MKINLAAYDAWLEYLDEWRNKFSFPLTRKQACEIIIDDRKYDSEKDDYTEPNMNNLFWHEWEQFAYKTLEG